MVPFLSICHVHVPYDGRGGWHRTSQINLRPLLWLPCHVRWSLRSSACPVTDIHYRACKKSVSRALNYYILSRAATSFLQYHILRGMFIPFSRLFQTVTRPSAPLASRLLPVCINSRRLYLRTMSTEAPIVPTSPSSVADPLGKGKYIQTAGCIIIG